VSGSIKPPGGGSTPIDPLAEAEGLAQADEAAGSAAPEGAREPAAPTGTAAWLERLDTGQITPEQAVDGIVSEALESHGAGRLDPARRAELESVLRAALLEDPTLSALLSGSR